MTQRKDRVHRILSKEQRNLPVKLTDPELLGKGRAAGALGFEIESIDAQIDGLKTTAKGLQATRDTRDNELRQIVRCIRAGVEDRPVEVVVEADMRTGEVREVRYDTGEVLSTRGMTKDEAQGALFDGPEPAAEPDEPIDVTPAKALPPRRRKKDADPDEGEDRA